MALAVVALAIAIFVGSYGIIGSRIDDKFSGQIDSKI